MLRPSFLLLSSSIALALSTAACSFGLGESTEGDQGNLRFEYTGGDCLFGCGLDRNALQGSLVSVAVTGGDGDVRKSARLTNGSLGSISEQRESCRCESQTRSGSSTTSSSSSVEPTAACAAGTKKTCTLNVDIETVQSGESKLEITDASGRVVDRVTMHVRPAARIDVEVRQGGTEVNGVYEVRNGFKVKVHSTVLDDEGGEMIFARHGVSHEYGDRSVLKPDGAVLIGSTDIEDMIASGVGETTVTVRAGGASKLLRFRVVP